jgi:CBS domain containing-hemolysin-like protein
MAIAVAEIMNPELFSVHGEESAGDTIAYLLGLGITAAPVLDDAGRAIGFVAMRDLVDARAGTPISELMTTPADVVPMRATIREAAALMARRSRHHVVCVDVDGRAVGFVSLLDVVRGLIGAPVGHPDTSSHCDPSTGLHWTDPVRLGLGTVELAPRGPGVLLLIDGTPGRPDRVLWSKAVSDVRAQLDELVHRIGAVTPEVRDAALAGHLWFRTASTTRDGWVTPAGPYPVGRREHE